MWRLGGSGGAGVGQEDLEVEVWVESFSLPVNKEVCIKNGASLHYIKSIARGF